MINIKNIDNPLLQKQLDRELQKTKAVLKKYPMTISQYYLGLIKKKNDPIWQQCLPSLQELEDTCDNMDDPLEEESATPIPYLVHKYPDRALLLISNKCAVYCRFCTRKRKVGRAKQISLEAIFNAIDYIKSNKQIRDVILSGGDPLLRTNKELELILNKLKAINHVEIIRIGTRVPCVYPQRITVRLASLLKKYHPLYINIHFNHPLEITPEATKVCSILADAGIPLGSQTVLLKGINDSEQVIAELFKKLLKIRVKPYYLYQCDMVKGANHFRTSIEAGLNIIKKTQGFISGLAIPQFVTDTAGGKIPILPQYLKTCSQDGYVLANYQDKLFSVLSVQNKKTTPFKSKILKIGLAFNLKKIDASTQSAVNAEYDDIETIDALRQAIQSLGHDVLLLEADNDFSERLKASQVDFVFNIAEGIQGESRESHIPAILEMLGIPYSGSGVFTQSITLNKYRKKELLLFNKIPTPKFQVFDTENFCLDTSLQFPLMVKPNSEGSSIGITNDSVVFNIKELQKQIKRILINHKQPVLVEEYLTGREFTVAIIGNKNLEAMPIVEVTFDHLPEYYNKIDSYEAKWTYDNPNFDVDPLICPAKISNELEIRLKEFAIKTFQVLGCVDFARIDFRLDDNGIPNVLDVNALPGLNPDIKYNSRFVRACYANSMTYKELIKKIINVALKRYGMRKK